MYAPKIPQKTYIDDADPWMGILSAAAFAVRSIYHTTKSKSPGKLVFGQDMILPINHVVDCKYGRQRKQTQIDHDDIQENAIRIDHDYRQGDKVMTRIKSAFKYKTLYRAPYKKNADKRNYNPRNRRRNNKYKYPKYQALSHSDCRRTRSCIGSIHTTISSTYKNVHNIIGPYIYTSRQKDFS